ncbi:MAG: DUF1998 domain-containing protein [Myxococcales bacterium]|nr:DUF1998 domain-containing protein [Myxococcales bacterium]
MSRKRSHGYGKKNVVPPEGRVRASQIVTTFGPGSMVDLLDHAILVGGLDYWEHRRGKTVLQNVRLRDRLAEMFAEADIELAKFDTFVEPPAGDENQPDKGHGVQALEFPQWFVCQECRALVHARHLGDPKGEGKRYRHHCAERRQKKGADCVPVRFVAACKEGHLSEWPWPAWVHQGRGDCVMPDLRLEEGETGDFSEVRVVCSACGARRRLADAVPESARPRCQGERPWLGPRARETCGEKMRLLVRTASNGYFAQVVSALSIPERGLELYEFVHDNLKTFQLFDSAEEIEMVRRKEPFKTALESYDNAAVFKTLEAVKSGKRQARDPLRTAEFKQLTQQPEERPGELPNEESTFFARRAVCDEPLPAGVGSVVLAKKLLELRVQVGFTRLEAATPDLQGEYDIGARTQVLALNRDWLPATQIQGEGILVVLDEQAVQAWEKRPAVLARHKALVAGYDKWLETASYKPPFPGARFYLLHSLSHLLISAISLECGYAASAIRERIYCSLKTDTQPMAAILLMTGSSGAEGTLGGLVEQGRRIRGHLRHAFDLGTLCSSDPVCAAHSPKADPAERYLEGAACHGCLYIAECSCERFNRYLDRALVVPTIGHTPELAFFSERP